MRNARHHGILQRIGHTAIACACLTSTLLAWGPHGEITQAAVDTLPADDLLRSQLGPEIARLKDYCWMGDMRRSLKREADAWFYADDYLLFPGMTQHRDHICPEVKQTYEPYFRRALAALRTETPVNAARWIGAVLHFTEDTGSPPHAAEIRGEVHSKMENWVQAEAITIAGYRPQLLGLTDDEAVAGFLHRMDGLIEFSKLRAQRAKPYVLADDRSSTEPIVLESALETSRVVADLLHTLGQLASRNSGSAALRGTITSTAPTGLEKLPAKIMLLDTIYSTLADPRGRYEFRHLPSGLYALAIIRPGCRDEFVKMTLSADTSTVQEIALRPDTADGNLLRNPSLESAWLAPTNPDGWYPIHRRGEHYWESDLLPLDAGAKYQLTADWQAKSPGQIVVRLLPGSGVNVQGTDLKPLVAGDRESEFVVPAGTTCARVLIYGQGSPADVCRHVAVSRMP
jgi:hypothetical protein